MLVSLGWKDLPKPGKPVVAAIGNFDGLHIGHRKIMACLLDEARRDRLVPTVLTFYPHPEKVLGQRPTAMIDTLEQRLDRLEALGIGWTVVVPFDQEFAATSCTDFLRNVVAGAVGAGKIVVGENFRFGKGRKGDLALLTAFGRENGITVLGIPRVSSDGAPVSSSRIRTALRKGAVEEAAALLGRPYEITGKVVSGDSRGSKLGFPTANVLPENEILPPGVYISETIFRNEALPSVTFIGNPATFGKAALTVETHILGFSGDLFGAKLGVRLLARTRAVRKFAGPAALSAQISRDIAQAMAFFGMSKGE